MVGVSGASGVVYGLRVLDACRDLGVESHLILSRAAALTLVQETGLAVGDIHQRAAVVHKPADIGASVASGSFPTLGMIVAPCSIRTLSAIATSAANNLLVRAADVQLKERRRVVLMVRETPLHLGHLRAMTAATEIGAIIAPPVPAFYHKPASMAEVIDQTARRAIDLLDLDLHLPVHEWEGEDRIRDAGQR